MLKFIEKPTAHAQCNNMCDASVTIAKGKNGVPTMNFSLSLQAIAILGSPKAICIAIENGRLYFRKSEPSKGYTVGKNSKNRKYVSFPTSNISNANNWIGEYSLMFDSKYELFCIDITGKHAQTN